MEKFLYVFNPEARDELSSAGFKLLKSDTKNDVYVFVNRADMTFTLNDVSFVRSNTLIF